MIRCLNVTKTYDNNYIFKGFNYSFSNKGMYVLFGDSGCGKTTLLNILSGLTTIDEGEIIIDNESFKDGVNNARINNVVSYITQDTYFVDYLTIEDNINLCCKEKDLVEKYIYRFGFKEKLQQYPSELSGGERQRLAIIQALIQKKKILILDEPTASLDEKNKQMVFDMLNDLKKEVLIICSAHDEMILQYADSIIDFSNIKTYEKECNTNFYNDIMYSQQINVDKKNVEPLKEDTKTKIMKFFNESKKLYSYIRKQKKYRNKEKSSSIILLLIISFTLGVIYYSSDFEKKLYQTMEKMYKLNALEVEIKYDNYELQKSIFNEKGVVDKTYSYKMNVPTFGGVVPDESNVCSQNQYFEINIGSLPLKNVFPYSDRIICGKYFSNENQILLGKEKAKEISSDVESLVGQKYKISLPDGEYEFEIAGIGDFSDEAVMKYFENSQGLDNPNSSIYITNKFLERYENDTVIGDNEVLTGRVVYILFFDKYSNIERFMNKYKNVEGVMTSGYKKNNARLKLDLVNVKCLFYPIIIMCMVIAIVFYYEIKRIELANNSHIICIYQYYGYKLRNIKFATNFYYIIEIIKLFLLAVIITIITTFISNIIAMNFRLSEYKLFVFDLRSTLILFVLLFSVSIVLIGGIFRKLSINGWYSVLKTRRDLL